MELALTLVLLVIAELVISVWLLSRHKQYLDRIGFLEGRVRDLDNDIEMLTSLQSHKSTDAVETNKVTAGNDASIASLVSQATPEDIQQAAAVLKALGVKVDD